MGGKGSGSKFNPEIRLRVRALLARKTPALNFAEIGDLLGVSRERVRQIAKEFGVTGRIPGGGFRGARRVNSGEVKP